MGLSSCIKKAEQFIKKQRNNEMRSSGKAAADKLFDEQTAALESLKEKIGDVSALNSDDAAAADAIRSAIEDLFIDRESLEIQVNEQGGKVAAAPFSLEDLKPKVTAAKTSSVSATSPIMRRDDIVGAIMRVTGGKGIAPVMAGTLVGDSANNATKLRGLFRNGGWEDMSDLAELLSVEEGYDVRDASHLEELVREAAAGNLTYSMARMERDKSEGERRQYVDSVNQKAVSLGLKGVRGKRTLEVVESDIAAKEKEISELEANEERAAILASDLESEIYKEGSELTEADLMQWLGDQVEYTQEEIDEANSRAFERENRLVEANAGYDSEGQEEGRVAEGDGTSPTESGARGTSEAEVGDGKGQRVTGLLDLPSNSIIRDENGNQYRVHYQRNYLVIAHPIVDGKAQVSSDATVRFWVSQDRSSTGPSDRTDPIYVVSLPDGFSLSKQTNEQAAQQFAAQQEGESDQVTKEQADRERDAVPFSMEMQSQPKPQGVQTGLFTADGRVSSDAKSGAEPAESKSIDDFGEKLEGAKKDRAPSLSQELTDDDIASQPFSKIWPAAEIDGIENKFAAAVAFAARNEIPSKPRTSYKVSRWVEKVKVLRGLASQIVASGEDVSRAVLAKTSGVLADLKSKVALLEAIDRNQWSRIGSVSEHPDAYRFENGEKITTSFVRAEIDGKNHYFDGAKSVADVVEKVNGLLGVDAQEKKMQFEVRTRRSSGETFINKKGDSEHRPLKTFANSKEAFDFIKSNYDDLVSAWDDVKNRDNVSKTDVRNAENRPRTGSDWRGGNDVTTEKFESAFGFRGVQFGEWVKQGGNAKDRQGMLNQAYDALMDLADIVGVPPKALSLNGSLGLAFGARGSGNAAAHYEPGNLVINLTKTKGAGTFAHEWFHALDNYFSRMRSGEVKMTRGMNAQQSYRSQNYITYRPEPMMVHKSQRSTPITRAKLNEYHEKNPNSGYYNPSNWHVDPSHPEGVRPEVERAFAELVEALDASPMKARAAKNDKGADGYWSRIIERGARSFENYVISKMMEKGYNNDYLANVREVENFPRAKERYPYLLPEEVAPIAEAFDNLFSTVETKETENGIALYSDSANYAENGEYRTFDDYYKAQASAFNGRPEVERTASVSTNLRADDGIANIRRRAGSVLANGVSADFRDRSATKLTGKVIRTPEDLAVAAQVYRNPMFETARYFFIKDGVVVGQTAVSSRKPGVTKALVGDTMFDQVEHIDDIADQASSLGADSIWLLHNHPDGKPIPSEPDVKATIALAGAFESRGFKVPYHVIINNKSYGVLNVGEKSITGSVNVFDFGSNAQYSIDNPKVSHALLGSMIYSPTDLALNAKKAQVSPGQVVIIGLSGGDGIRTISEVTPSQLRGKFGAAILRRIARQTGSDRLFAYGVAPSDMSSVQSAIKSGLLADAIVVEDGVEMSVIGMSPSLKKRDGYSLGTKDSGVTVEMGSSSNNGDEQKSRNYNEGVVKSGDKDARAERAKHEREQFWRRLGEGDSFTGDEYVSSIVGSRGDAWRGAVDASVFPGGRGAISWVHEIAGFKEGYVTYPFYDAHGDFNVVVVPLALVPDRGLSHDSLKDLSITTMSIRDAENGDLEFGVSEPNKGTTAFHALQEKGKIHPTGQFTDDGKHEYYRVDIGHAHTVKLIQETIRRYAINQGSIGAIKFGRDTGSVGGKGVSRRYTAEEIKAKFAKDAVNTNVSPAQVRSALTSRFGEKGIAALEKTGMLKIMRLEDAPESIKQEAEEQGASALYTQDGVAYLFSDRMNADEAPGKLLHEIGEHHGLENMLGAEGWGRMRKRIVTMAKIKGSVAFGAWDGVKAKYNEFDGMSDSELSNNDRFLHEVLAAIGENQAGSKTSLWRELVAQVKEWLASKGFFTESITEGDIANLVSGSLKKVMRKAESGLVAKVTMSDIAYDYFKDIVSAMKFSQLLIEDCA